MQEVTKRKPVEVFGCYAHQDLPLLLKLKKYLVPLQREGLIILWADLDIGAGSEWEKEIQHHLNTARIILFLVSPDFMASEYCYSVEMQRAIERHEQDEAQVIPIILRPVSWQMTPSAKFQALPTNANPITKWHSQDDAFYTIVEGIRGAAEARLAKEERIRLAAEAEQARLAEEKRIRLAAEAEQAHLAKEERRRQAQEIKQARKAAKAEQARLGEEERRRQAQEIKQAHLAEEERIYNLAQRPGAKPMFAQSPWHVGRIDQKPSWPIPGDTTLLVGRVEGQQQIAPSLQQETGIAVSPVQQRLHSVIKKGISITGMVIGSLFALFGILGLFISNQDIFASLWFGDLFFFFGLMIFFIAIIGWSPFFIPKAGKTRAVIGKLIGIKENF